MITIKNVKTIDGVISDFTLQSNENLNVDAMGHLLLLPGIIDSHISLGKPESKNWIFSIESALRGGITTILDVPSADFPCETKECLEQKKRKMDQQLSKMKFPMQYFPYVKGNSSGENIEQLGLQKNLTQGNLVLFTKDNEVLEDRDWDRIFQISAWEDLPVVINSDNENSWSEPSFKKGRETLLEKAFYFAEKQNTRVFVLNVSALDELALIQKARERSLLVYAETTLQHLYPIHGGSADFLWEALNQGVIEIMGTGFHAGANGQRNWLWHDAKYDFLNPIFFLPMLFTASLQGKIKLQHIVRQTRANLYEIFKLERKDDSYVLIDMEKEETVKNQNGKQTVEFKLKGWPKFTIIRGNVFQTDKMLSQTNV